MTRFRGRAIFAACTATALALTGCTSVGTPYQPLSSANRISGGYSDQRLAEDRYRRRAGYVPARVP